MNRKELIDRYKRTIQPMGVYQVRNLTNGKVFVGSSKNLAGIINRERFELKNGSHRNAEMQRDFREVGEDGFAFEVLDELKPREGATVDYAEELAALEELWLEKLQPYDERGYNERKR